MVVALWTKLARICRTDPQQIDDGACPSQSTRPTRQSAGDSEVLKS